MLVVGIAGYGGRNRTADLINLFLSSAGKKVGIADLNDLSGLDSSHVRDYISVLAESGMEILILKISIADPAKKIPENMHFDVMIYSDKAEDMNVGNAENYTETMRKIFAMLDEKGTAIVNIDYGDLVHFLEGMKRQVVTYGFNSKASMTASSIGDSISKNDFLCCLQRTISTKNGTLVEPQEYRLSIERGNFDAYSVLAASTFAIINGMDLNLINPQAAR